MKIVFAPGASHKDLLDFHDRLTEKLDGRATAAAASNLYGMVSERVQEEGKKTDGSLIGGGKYSPGYERYRQKKGRQTAFIDLTFTGDMLQRGFTLVPAGKTGWAIGFNSDTEYEKYLNNTKRYGQFLQPSRAEIELSLKDVYQYTTDAIRASR